MPLFAATIALSAFLLFLVQPLIAKQILPWFGGSAAVWTTCLVFFQCVLLAGYAYSDAVVRRLAPRAQALLHASLLIASLAFLPIVASEAFKPADADHPAGRILWLLAATIGLPYLVLSTTGPLIQAWFTKAYPDARVYRLYALSNVASMLALIAYPPLIEPNATGRAQSLGWSAAYAVFVLLALGCAWRAARTRPAAARPARSATPAAASQAFPAAHPSAREQSLWLLLAALGSVLLLSITTHITQNVASVPFLWVLPLAIYLSTFILCFDGTGWYRRSVYAPLACVLAALMIGALGWRPNWTAWSFGRDILPIDEAIPLYAFGLFACCMFCHGELVERKPAPAFLTRFYLMVSLGGALGGLLVGVVAPVVLDWYWEFPVALVVLVIVVLYLTAGVLQPIAAAALCASIVATWDHWMFVRFDTLERSRNFYGALRVKGADAQATDENARLRMLHGVILHGEQFRAPGLRSKPTTYYGETSGVARALFALRQSVPAGPQRVGLIGLGVGTLAAYGRAGDTYRVYELDPAVLELARRRFTFLSDTAARIETELGDARLSLEREPPQRFDLLAVDAFSSDSIPVHLITREAIREYRRHVSAHGVIAFHISNRYLELAGVVRRLAGDVGWQAVRFVDQPGDGSHLSVSDWVLVSANEAVLARLEAEGGQRLEAAGAPLWTDDFNNLFDVLK